MARFVLVMVLAVVSFQAQASAQLNETIIGTWKLVSAKLTTDTGEVRDSWGPNPVVFLTYTSAGRMSAILTFSGRKNLSVSDFISAPAGERAEAFASMTAYAGRYAFSGDKVIHHVEGASTPNDVGTNLERVIVQLDADRLVLRVAKPYLRGGIMVRQQELVWERVK
jgi:hypothetical protein